LIILNCANADGLSRARMPINSGAHDIAAGALGILSILDAVGLLNQDILQPWCSRAGIAVDNDLNILHSSRVILIVEVFMWDLGLEIVLSGRPPQNGACGIYQVYIEIRFHTVPRLCPL